MGQNSGILAQPWVSILGHVTSGRAHSLSKLDVRAQTCPLSITMAYL